MSGALKIYDSQHVRHTAAAARRVASHMFFGCVVEIARRHSFIAVLCA